MVDAEEVNQLSLISPGTELAGITVQVPTEITFTSLVTGTDNPPTILTLEEALPLS